MFPYLSLFILMPIESSFTNAELAVGKFHGHRIIFVAGKQAEARLLMKCSCFDFQTSG